jgi:peptide/nickel transport system substrate-binding protein
MQQEAVQREAYTSTLVIGTTTPLLGTEPYLFTGYWSWIYGGTTVFDPLVKGSPEVIYSKPEQYKPWLATSWTMAPDGLSYTFQLRHDVKYHDGTPFNASSAAFHFSRMRSPDVAKMYGIPMTRAWLAYLYDMLDDKQPAVALDTYTLKINLKYKFAPFISDVGAVHFTAFESPSAVLKWGKDFNYHPVGTGPFKFVSWTQGKEIVMTRNDDYWGNKPKIKTMIWRVYPDISTLSLALQNGEVDMTMIEFSISDLPKLEKDSRFVIMNAYGDMTISNLMINYRNKALGNPKVRQAIAYAIDREKIANVAYKGYAEPNYGPVPKQMFGAWATDPFKTMYPYNPDKAKQLLAEAGYKPGDIKVEYTIASPRDPYAHDSAVLIQGMLQNIGMDVTIKVIDLATTRTQLRSGAYDLMVGNGLDLSWTYDYPDPYDELVYLMDKGSYQAPYVGYLENNTSGWGFPDHYPEVRDLLLQSVSTSVFEQRLPAIQKLQQIWAEDVIAIPTFIMGNRVIMWNNVHGFLWTGGYRWAIDWTVVYKTYPPPS